MLIESKLIPQVYYSEDSVVKVINPTQYTKYIKNGVYPIDIFISFDHKTDKEITVLVFEKDKTKELHRKWCCYELD